MYCRRWRRGGWPPAVVPGGAIPPLPHPQFGIDAHGTHAHQFREFDLNPVPIAEAGDRIPGCWGSRSMANTQMVVGQPRCCDAIDARVRFRSAPKLRTHVASDRDPAIVGRSPWFHEV
jgi:hypothetical protein